MDAIQFLLKEHAKVKRDLSKISKKSQRDATKKKLFNNVCRDIIIHESMEERIWYPYLKANKKLKSRIKHLISEEKTAEKEIKKFKKIKSMDMWDEKFMKFKKAVLSHAAEEETKLFPKVKKALEKEELNDIAVKFRKFKMKFKKH